MSVGLNILDNQLTSRLPAAYEQAVVKTGATEFRTIVPAEDLSGVLRDYNASLRDVFIVGTRLSCISLLGAVFIEFRSVEGRTALAGGRDVPSAANRELDNRKSHEKSSSQAIT